MTKISKKHYLAFVLVLLAVISLLLIANSRTSKNGFANGFYYLSGTVTDYDERPSYSDGAIVFKIDGKSVDIGGGFREEKESGEIYPNIQVGDKVEAKLKQSSYGNLTIYNCKSCYIHLQ